MYLASVLPKATGTVIADWASTRPLWTNILNSEVFLPGLGQSCQDVSENPMISVGSILCF